MGLHGARFGVNGVSLPAWQPDWLKTAVFYHIYPLGFLACPSINPCITGDWYTPNDSKIKTLSGLADHYDHLSELGVNAVYFGPLFESESHGYDTIDYFQIDRRLGDNELFGRVVSDLHDRGIKVIIDGVFNHVSRYHFAYADLRKNLDQSAYRDWFKDVDFQQEGPFGYGFSCRGWERFAKLPELNLDHPDVRRHVLDAATWWVRELDIDGWRLDVAYCIGADFWAEFRREVKAAKADAFLLGEVDQGDYRAWVNPRCLDSVTNYQLYASLVSAINSRNLHELRANLERAQHSEWGLYKNFPLMNFLSNHDVPRVASLLTDARAVYPAMILLFTLPGVPCLYYGDEFGMKGEKIPGDNDADLRRPMPAGKTDWPEFGEDLFSFAQKLIDIRKRQSGLIGSQCEVLSVGPDHLAYLLRGKEKSLLAAINISDEPLTIELQPIYGFNDGQSWVDLLEGRRFTQQGHRLQVELPPMFGIIVGPG